METEVVAGAPRLSVPIRSLARFVNPVLKPLAGGRFFPLWAVLRHTGRRSGAAYATPVVARPTKDGFVIPLPFGNRTQWARNLVAGGGGTLRVAGREWPVREPEIVEWPDVRTYFNPALRFLVARLGIRHFVRVRLASRLLSPADASAAVRRPDEDREVGPRPEVEQDAVDLVSLGVDPRRSGETPLLLAAGDPPGEWPTLSQDRVEKVERLRREVEERLAGGQADSALAEGGPEGGITVHHDMP